MIVKCTYNYEYCVACRLPSNRDGLCIEVECNKQENPNKCKDFDYSDNGAAVPCRWCFMAPTTIIREVDSVDIHQGYVEFGNVHIDMCDLITLEVNYGNGFETECYGFSYEGDDEEDDDA